MKDIPAIDRVASRVSICRRAACLILALALFGCAGTGDKSTSSKEAAIAVARAYLQKNMPDQVRFLNTKKYDTFAVDLGNAWGVGFMPVGMMVTGGSPKLDVDKKSLRVVKVDWAM